MPRNHLDLLPVELVHNIFTYLSTHEIFYAFSNVTDYLDAILVGYDRYALNFRSVLKSHFDVTCRSIQPDRVISLTLSDDDEIPTQSELLFSRFNIEQFIHLRSFDMSLMHNDTCKKLIHLDQLTHLSSLELPRLFQPFCQEFGIAVEKILPQLNRLMAYNTHYLFDNPLPNLRHLILKYCNCYHLSTLFEFMPNLQSLAIILVLDNSWLHNVPVVTNLKKFVLSTYGEPLTMVKIKEFLSKMPNLKHFELDTEEGGKDFLDGQLWESMVSHLIAFDFRIHLFQRPQQFYEGDFLQSFRSLFWLEQKRWFVAFDGINRRNLFTVPRFASSMVIYPYTNWPPVCTSSEFYFDSYIKTLYMSSLEPVPHRFTNITSLIFDTHEISTTHGGIAFVNLLEQMQFLYSISFRDLSVLQHLPDEVAFKKIRKLEVRDKVQAVHRLCTIFPRLERLNIRLTSRSDLLLLIDQLNYLSIAEFELDQSSLPVKRKWIIKNSRRLRVNRDFILKILYGCIHLWINNDTVSKNDRLFKGCSCTLQ